MARRLPDEQFPPYAFVPGQGPHPESDPAGHMYGRERAAAERLTEETWRGNGVYLLGMDFFDAGYYWESHVEFEALWVAEGRRGETADFLKGLIKLAAAGVKHREGMKDGVTSHARRAGVLFRSLGEEPPARFGLHLASLKLLASRIEDNGWPASPPELPEVGA